MAPVAVVELFAQVKNSWELLSLSSPSQIHQVEHILLECGSIESESSSFLLGFSALFLEGFLITGSSKPMSSKMCQTQSSLAFSQPISIPSKYMISCLISAKAKSTFTKLLRLELVLFSFVLVFDSLYNSIKGGYFYLMYSRLKYFCTFLFSFLGPLRSLE